jgi:hypothetical protein
VLLPCGAELFSISKGGRRTCQKRNPGLNGEHVNLFFSTGELMWPPASPDHRCAWVGRLRHPNIRYLKSSTTSQRSDATEKSKIRTNVSDKNQRNCGRTQICFWIKTAQAHHSPSKYHYSCQSFHIFLSQQNKHPGLQIYLVPLPQPIHVLRFIRRPSRWGGGGLVLSLT